jgi:hypothetical protein
MIENGVLFLENEKLIGLALILMVFFATFFMAGCTNLIHKEPGKIGVNWKCLLFARDSPECN